MEKVGEFVAHKARLKEMGFATSDYRRTYNTIMKLKKSGYDVKKIADQLESREDLQDLKDRLEKQCLESAIRIETNRVQRKGHRLLAGELRRFP